MERAYRELMKVGCTACEYCMPCPEGVDIPACFDVYNHLHMFQDEETSRFQYAVKLSGIISGADPGFASSCIQCEECLEKCPQQLEIPTLLESVAEAFEGAGFDQRLAMVRQFLKKR